MNLPKKPNLDKIPTIIVIIEGGVVQDVTITGKAIVLVHDYDTDDADQDIVLYKDLNGDEYVRTDWSS